MQINGKAGIELALDELAKDDRGCLGRHAPLRMHRQLVEDVDFACHGRGLVRREGNWTVFERATKNWVAVGIPRVQRIAFPACVTGSSDRDAGASCESGREDP